MDHALDVSLDVVVTTVASDSHTWNLIYLQLLLQEMGHRVRNIGACPPEDLVVTECLCTRPDLVVVSSVNGHGLRDGARLGCRIRSRPELTDTHLVIGGKLGIAGSEHLPAREALHTAGYDAVYGDDGVMTAFRADVERLTALRRSAHLTSVGCA